ncbi:MAG: hypothetical protein HC936_12500 [Leptolyngbyaceae cyanobacterium SU_3_3]|nr:hypothetical protein [Leptolyngbyaceae cyanobacterium SU_3_3]
MQKHLDEHFGVDAVFVSIDIDKAVDELIENERSSSKQIPSFLKAKTKPSQDGAIKR